MWRRLRRTGLCANHHVFGLAWSGGMAEARFLRLVPHLRDEELAALLLPAVRRSAGELGIDLVSYGDLTAAAA